MKQVFSILIGVILLISACTPQNVSPVPSGSISSQPTANTSEIRITDALGRLVVLPNPPKRIVVVGKASIMVVDAIYLFPTAPERIAALGITGQGTSNFTALIDPNYAAKATLLQDSSAEQISTAQPDLVILKSALAETLGKPLDILKIPVIYVDFEFPDQYGRDLMILGKVFQNESLAQKISAFYQNKVAEIQKIVKGVEKKPRALMLYYSDKDGSVAFNVPPMNWMQTQIVQLAGGEAIWSSANPGNGWTKVTLEQIAAWDADQIFVIVYNKNSSEVVTTLKTDAKWKALRAVKNGKLWAFPADIYSWDQPDTRWILGLSWLAKHLHPDLFPKLDIIQETRQFYQDLYGLDTPFFEAKIRPTFKGDLP